MATGLIAITNTFTSGTTAIHSQWNTNFTDITNGLSDASMNVNIGSMVVSGNVVVTGDIYTRAWSAYTSTVYGYAASMTMSSVMVKRIGRTVEVTYGLAGILTGSTAYFTLPYDISTAMVHVRKGIGVGSMNDGLGTVRNSQNIFANSNTVSIISENGEGNLNYGNLTGQFTYETDA